MHYRAFLRAPTRRLAAAEAAALPANAAQSLGMCLVLPIGLRAKRRKLFSYRSPQSPARPI